MTDLIKQIRRLPQATVVEAMGEVDLRRQPEFQKALLVVCEERPARLIIDLGQVSYMDSSGVGTLVKIAHTVKGQGGRMTLVGPSPRVRSIFEVTSLDRYFHIVATEAEALQA